MTITTVFRTLSSFTFLLAHVKKNPISNYVGVHIVLLISGQRQRQLHTNYLGNPCINFFLGGMFFVSHSFSFDFCYDLYLCSQGQAVREFFIGMGFSLNLSKVQEGF